MPIARKIPARLSLFASPCLASGNPFSHDNLCRIRERLGHLRRRDSVVHKVGVDAASLFHTRMRTRVHSDKCRAYSAFNHAPSMASCPTPYSGVHCLSLPTQTLALMHDLCTPCCSPCVPQCKQLALVTSWRSATAMCP